MNAAKRGMNGSAHPDPVVVKRVCQFGNLVMQVPNIACNVKGRLCQKMRLYEGIMFVLVTINVHVPKYFSGHTHDLALSQVNSTNAEQLDIIPVASAISDDHVVIFQVNFPMINS